MVGSSVWISSAVPPPRSPKLAWSNMYIISDLMAYYRFEVFIFYLISTLK